MQDLGRVQDPHAEPAVITRIYERHACYYVEGHVCRNGTWLKAAFTVSKADVDHMTENEFQAYALRCLPVATEDQTWDAVMA